MDQREAREFTNMDEWMGDCSAMFIDRSICDNGLDHLATWKACSNCIISWIIGDQKECMESKVNFALMDTCSMLMCILIVKGLVNQPGQKCYDFAFERSLWFISYTCALH